MSKRDNIMSKYGLPEFEDLKTSTKTLMIYTNICFNLDRIFQELKITSVDVPLTKKKKNVDKKRLVAPYGAIISVMKGIKFRGIDIRKKRKHWCTANCRIVEKRGNKDVSIHTVIEEPYLIEGTDIHEIKYFCTNCKQYYSLKQLKKITNFLNQVTIVLSIGHIILNIMMFKDNFKLAGCKYDDDATEATIILWKNYIRNISDGWHLKPEALNDSPKFVFSLVMKNVDFKLGFSIDREKLNILMNSPIYKDKVFMSQCETTGHTNVNIKMYTAKPTDYKYDCLVIPIDTDAFFIQLSSNPYKPNKQSKNEYATLIAFSSSEIILSGRYDNNMKEIYEFFVAEVIKNRNVIEEKINKPSENLLTHLQTKN